VIKVDIDFAQNAQLLGESFEGKNGDRIAVDIAQPTHGRRRLYFEAGPRNMDVVTFTRPQQRTVRAESDGLIVQIFRLVNDSDALHDFPRRRRRSSADIGAGIASDHIDADAKNQSTAFPGSLALARQR
jgi:hypothetical protein